GSPSRGFRHCGQSRSAGKPGTTCTCCHAGGGYTPDTKSRTGCCTRRSWPEPHCWPGPHSSRSLSPSPTPCPPCKGDTAMPRDERERDHSATTTHLDEMPRQLDLLTTLDTTDNQHQDQKEHDHG